jgi:hypothetical protein
MLEKVGVWMVCEYEKVMKRVEFSWLRVGEKFWQSNTRKMAWERYEKKFWYL